MGREAIRRIPPFRRYLRRQVSISRHRLKRLRIQPEMGPCLRRGLRRRGETLISHKVRLPGAGRGLPLLERGARARASTPAFTGAGPAQHERSGHAAKNRLILSEVEG